MFSNHYRRLCNTVFACRRVLLQAEKYKSAVVPEQSIKKEIIYLFILVRQQIGS